MNGSQSFGSLEVTLEQLFGSDTQEKERNLALMCSAYPEADLSKSLGSLSGGQRRRAVLAAIVYHTLTGGFEDGVLFVDEPTNDLGSREIRSLIKGFRRLSALMPNLAIVITTHEGGWFVWRTDSLLFWVKAMRLSSTARASGLCCLMARACSRRKSEQTFFVNVALSALLTGLFTV